MRRPALAAVVVVLAPAAARADDDTRELGLATAVAAALRHNDTVLAERTDVAIADAEVRASSGADEVVVEGQVGALIRDTEPVAGPFFQETSLDQLAASIGVWKPLATGGRLGVTFRDDVTRARVRIDAGEGPIDLSYTVHAPRTEVVLVQPLLRGRGRRATHAARRTAAAARDAQAAEARRAEAVLVHDVTVTYWELAYASREVAIRSSALALAHEQLAVTRARADVGRGSELEVVAVEQAIAAREAAVLAAEQGELERALELRVLMKDDGGRGRVVATDPLDTGAAEVDRAATLAAALAFSPDLGVLGEHLRAARVERDAATRDLLPRLDLVVRGGPAGNAGGAGEALAQLARFDSFGAEAMLTFSIPIGNRAAEGRRDAARLRERRIGHAREEVRGQLTAAVQRATDAIELAERRIVAAAKAAELARRNVELQIVRWEHGAGTNFDVLDRQDQLAAAEAELARARTDLRIAVAQVAYLTGAGLP
jgi:outer membrane protein TolC